MPSDSRSTEHASSHDLPHSVQRFLDGQTKPVQNLTTHHICHNARQLDELDMWTCPHCIHGSAPMEPKRPGNDHKMDTSKASKTPGLGDQDSMHSGSLEKLNLLQDHACTVDIEEKEHHTCAMHALGKSRNCT